MQTDDATVKRVPKGVQIAIGALVCAALLGWYGATNLGGEASYRYFDTLEEFLAAGPATRAGERLRPAPTEIVLNRRRFGRLPPPRF